MAVISADMVFVLASKSARVGSAMAADCAVETVEEGGAGGGWAWWAVAPAVEGGPEVESEDRRIFDTKLSRASNP